MDQPIRLRDVARYLYRCRLDTARTAMEMVSGLRDHDWDYVANALGCSGYQLKTKAEYDAWTNASDRSRARAAQRAAEDIATALDGDGNSNGAGWEPALPGQHGDGNDEEGAA